MSGLLGALGMLTVLPVPRRFQEGPLARTAPFFPLVGALFGLLWAAPLAALVSRPHAAPRLAVSGASGPVLVFAAPLLAGLAVALGELCTRFLHLDGLGDTADALWGGGDAAARLAIMRDPRSGSFAVAAITLDLLVKVSALTVAYAAAAAGVLGGTVTGAVAFAALALPAVYGRSSATLLAAVHGPARAEGLAVGWLAGRSRAALGVSCLAVVAVPFAVLPPLAAASCGVAFVVWTWTLGALLARPVGGMTGDLFGAAIELTETAAAVVSAFALIAAVFRAAG